MRESFLEYVEDFMSDLIAVLARIADALERIALEAERGSE